MNRSTHSQHRGARSQGFTLIEVAVVTAIIALMMVGATLGLRSLTRADLRSATSRTAASMRYAFDRATMTGSYMRVALDMEAGAVWLETSDDMITLRAGREQHIKGTEEEKDEAARAKQDAAEGKARPKPKKSSALDLLGLGGGSEEEEEGDDEDSGDEEEFSGGIDVYSLNKEYEQDLQPIERPKASFKPLRSIVSKRIKLAKGVKVAAVTTPRMTKPAVKGTAYVYFFPQGHSEPAVIHLSAREEEYYSIVLHPLTGKTEVYPCYYDIPDDFGVSDDKKKRRSGTKPCANQGGL